MLRKTVLFQRTGAVTEKTRLHNYVYYPQAQHGK